MAYRLCCRDIGMDCDFTVTGTNTKEMIKKEGEHAMQKHSISDREINSPNMLKKIRAAIKKV